MGCRALLFHVHSPSHSQLDVESSCKEKPFRVIYSECSGNGRGGNEIRGFYRSASGVDPAQTRADLKSSLLTAHSCRAGAVL